MIRHGHVKMAVAILAGLIGAAAGAGAARADAGAAVAPTFAAKPSAVSEGGGMKISFAASAATDAHVAILDAKGQVVTGLLYIDDNEADLHTLLDTTGEPLNAVPMSDLCPGNAQLAKINKSLR